MKISIFYSYLLAVCLVYVDVGFSLPDTLNVTDSSPSSNDHQTTGDEVSNIEKNEGTKLGASGPEAGDQMESPPFASHEPRTDFPCAWETRHILSRRNRRGVLRPSRSFTRRERDYGMSPRSFSRGRRFGYGGRYPSRFSRYAPYGRRYERDQYMMGNYEPYPQPFQAQPFPDYQQPPQQFSPQSQFPLSGRPQQSYFRPQTSLASAQSYRDPYTGMQSQQLQQPQQFAAAPQYFPDDQQMNVRPQLVPSSSSSSYYTNSPGLQRGNQEQPVRSDPFSQFGTPNQLPTNQRRAGAGSQTMNLPTLRGNRYHQPTAAGSQLPSASASGSFNQFGAPSSLQPSSADQRDGARSRTMVAEPATIRGNGDRPIGSQLQRKPGSFDQFRNAAQASVDERGDAAARLRENRENRDQPVGSEQFQGTSGSNDQAIRNSTQPSAQPVAETATAPTPETNDAQSDGQRPLTGLFSFFRGPSTTTESNSPQTRSAAGLESQQTRQPSKLAPSAQSQAATVAA